MFLSFICSSARLLVTQNRLLLTKEALRREAARDSLTGLWNRKAIMSILERELMRAERDQQPIGLIMIDVDHFKSINDTRGHSAGDAVLRIIASGIAAMVPETSIRNMTNCGKWKSGDWVSLMMSTRYLVDE